MSGAPPHDDDLRQPFVDLDDANGGCPDRDRIWQAVSGRLPREQTLDLIEHTGNCGSCAQLWRLAREMGAMEDPAARAAARSRWIVPAAAAAALLAVVFGARLFLAPGPVAPEPAYRAAGSEALASRVAEGIPQPRSGLRLAWSAGPEGAVYNVKLSTEKLVPVASAEGLERAEFVVPEEALRGLPPAARLLWQVEMFTPDGKRETSETFFVVIE